MKNTLAASSNNDASIIALVDHLLTRAHQSGASDLHMEPLAATLRVRFRRDGLLHEGEQLPKKCHAALLSRFKIMTQSMDIAEKRLPQEGRFQTILEQQQIDVRVATMPTLHGESMVLRLLNPSAFAQGLSELGLEKEDQIIFQKLLEYPDGFILVTGPTGSGKTTTLYACLNELVRHHFKIMTVEDPVEYRIPGVNQVQVHEEIGMTFSAVLRSMLRQATNKIMVGEIRDRETAACVMNASLTGHLVFSTLHTNDAPSAIARLITMGVPSFMLASSLRAVIAQRLVRRLCIYCKEKNRSACAHCHGRGFHGRVGIFEILVLDETLRHQIHHHATTEELRSSARGRGMKTLREDGLRKVLAGLTTAEEILRHC